MVRVKCIYSVASFLLLSLFLALPSGVTCWFDGLPFSTRAEAFSFALLLPFLLLLGYKFLSLRCTAIALLILAICKIYLAVFAPQSGLDVLIYESPSKFKKGAWEKTYTTFWRPGVSDVMERAWLTTSDFPIEWLNRYNANAPRRKARPVISLKGWAATPKGYGLVFLASGLKKGHAQWSDDKGGTGSIPIVNNLNKIPKPELNGLPKGRFLLDAHLVFGSPKKWNWSLIPYLITAEGKAVSAFRERVFWRTDSGSRSASAHLYKKMADTLGFAFLGVIVWWGVWCVFCLWKRRVLGWDLVLAIIIGPALWKGFLLLGMDGVMALNRAAAIVLAGLALFALRRERMDKSWQGNLGIVLLITLVPLIFTPYVIKWWPDAGIMQFFDPKNDYLTYHNLAREMALGGDWLQSEIKVLNYQPLYRYFVALLHIIGGQSPLLLKMLDVWAVICGGILTVLVGRRLGLTVGFAMTAGWLYFFHLLGDRFVFLIAKSLQEYVAMAAMLLAAFWALKSRDNESSFYLPGFAGLIGQLLRQEHLGGLAGISLFRAPDAVGGFRDAWRKLFEEAWRYKYWLMGYWGFLIAAVLLVAFRNYCLGDMFTLLSTRVVGFLSNNTWDRIWFSLDFVLSGDNRRFMISSIILWSGSLAGIAALFLRLGPLKQYPLQLSLVISAVILPYFFVMANAYPPRFSIHLLPFACLSVAFVIQGLMQYRPGRKPISPSETDPGGRLVS